MSAILWSQAPMPSRSILYLLSLVAVVSLVYSATRHEDWGLILKRAVRLSIVIIAIMAFILVIIAGIQAYPYVTLAVLCLGIVALFVTHRR